MADKELREKLLRLRPYNPENPSLRIRNAVFECDWFDNDDPQEYWKGFYSTCGNHLLRPDWAELPDDWEPDATVMPGLNLYPTEPKAEDMTLRDWYAGMALIGLLSGVHEYKEQVMSCVDTSFEVADAMMEARTKQKQTK